MKEISKPIELPFYAKTALVLVSIISFVYVIIIAQDIIIPIIYAIIFAILLNPLVNFLIRKNINKVVAIILTVLLAFAVVSFLFYLILSQAANFSQSWPILLAKFNFEISELINWLSQKTNIEIIKINEYIANTKNAQIDKLSIGAHFIKLGHTVSTIVLLPLYIVMILFYKPLLLGFIRSTFKTNDHIAVSEVLQNTKTIIQSYIVGLFIETTIIAILNSIGLLIIGIDYAILLGCLGALLNILPYVGAIIAASIFMAIALLTMSPIYMLYVLILYLFVQFIDNAFLIPKIVAQRVRINALVSIIVVIIGGTIWGVPGMFLAIPLTAILKVIFDHVDSLKPWGVLLGDTTPTFSKYLVRKRTKIKN